MNYTKKETETALLKLATIGKAAKALAMAADANGLTPEEISGIVIALAIKELQ